jgi:LPS export ABC transporter permease LptF/LPS export ABC transporter permease LptG
MDPVRMRTLDRYIIRETVLPFVISLVVFTFVLLIPFVVELAESMIAKGVPWPMLLKAMATLIPAQLGLTIPMSLLIALLVAFGRLSGDREIVVMMACGVSPYQLLRPVTILAVMCWAATSWVMLEAIPSANQAFRELSVQIAQDRAEQEVRPRVFFEDFPDTVLYVRNATGAGAGWEGVLAADTRNKANPELFIAARGRMLVDRQAKTIQMMLENGTRHRTSATDPAFYEVLQFKTTIVNLNPESVFPRSGPAPGDREMTIAQLRERIAVMEKQGISTHNPIMEIHKKFSIPVACFVFALVGLALGVSNRKDGKMASFVLGIGVIFVYYVVMFTAQSMTKGHMMPPELAMWVPNIVLGAAGAILLFVRSRSADQPIRITLPSLPRPDWLRKWFSREPSPVGGAPAMQTAVGAPSRPGNVVLVIRVPQFELPRPSLLDLYVGKLYLRILGMAAIGMAGLFYIATFIDLSDKVFKGEATMAMVLSYLWYETPQFLYYILALAVLLSALVTVGLLTKNSELIVMRACGVSLYRTAMPLLVFAFLASGVLFGLEERVLAASNRRAEQLKHVIKGGSPQTFDVLNRKWIVGPNGEIYHYIVYNPQLRQLSGLTIYEFDESKQQLSRRTFASQASFDAAATRAANQPVWQAQGGWVRDFSAKEQSGTYQPFDSTTLQLESADYFVTEAPEPERMNFGQLRRYIDDLRASGYHLLEHEVALQRKLAFPFVTLVMTLIAVPFAVTTGRRGAMYGIGIGIVLALIYWTMISVFAAFGSAAVIPPTLAAWAPNLLFGATAAYLLLTVRT